MAGAVQPARPLGAISPEPASASSASSASSLSVIFAAAGDYFSGSSLILQATRSAPLPFHSATASCNIMPCMTLSCTHHVVCVFRSCWPRWINREIGDATATPMSCDSRHCSPFPPPPPPDPTVSDALQNPPPPPSKNRSPAIAPPGSNKSSSAQGCLLSQDPIGTAGRRAFSTPPWSNFTRWTPAQRADRGGESLAPSPRRRSRAPLRLKCAKFRDGLLTFPRTGAATSGQLAALRQLTHS